MFILSHKFELFLDFFLNSFFMCHKYSFQCSLLFHFHSFWTHLRVNCYFRYLITWNGTIIPSNTFCIIFLFGLNISISHRNKKKLALSIHKIIWKRKQWKTICFHCHFGNPFENSSSLPVEFYTLWISRVQELIWLFWRGISLNERSNPSMFEWIFKLVAFNSAFRFFVSGAPLGTFKKGVA